MRNRVLIVGCGELGSRHLQAVSTLPHVKEIEVVDPRPEAHRLGRERLAEVTDRQPQIRLRWLTSLDEAAKGGDLCIVATNASVRPQLVEQIVRTLGYQTFILEKLVAQSTAEYKALVEFSRLHGLTVWVNFQTRGHPFHRMMKERLNPSDPITVTVMAGNNGLVTNGVHWADLFVFYDGCASIESVGSIIDQVLHQSKRGPHVFDLSGTLRGRTQKGSQLVLSYVGVSRTHEPIYIASRDVRAIVDHVQGWAAESDAQSGWRWKTRALDDSLYVSHTTRVFASDILATRCCQLPTLEEAFVAHQFLLDELQPSFSQLLGVETDACPVT